MTLVSFANMANRRRNCLEQTWAYLDNLLDCAQGLKVLLCDEAARSVLTIAYSQHQLLRHNVVWVDMLSNKERYQMKHFACIILCRPVASSLLSVFQELAEGNFASYAVGVTYLIEPSLLQSLANADVWNLIVWTGEVYVDAIPLNEWTCIVPLQPFPLTRTRFTLPNPMIEIQWTTADITRMAESVISTSLASNRRPIIRYRANNPIVEKLASEIATRMQSVHAIFPDVNASESVILLVDRLDDPLTPLLMPWTYEAMIAELIGFERGNEVVINDPEAASSEECVHVLTPSTDSFFSQHRYDDWGQVCLAISDLVKAYKEMNNFDRDTVSLEEIKHFMTRFPEARKQSVQVTRHCGIASQLVAEINGRNLTKLSVLEQDILTSNNIAEHSRLVLEVVQDVKTDVDDALRMTMLYALRYEKNPSHIIPQLKQELGLRQCPPERVELIDSLLTYAGQDRRAHELFKTSTGHIFKSVAKAVGQFGREVQNVLTQHTPLLKKLINRVYNGTLSVNTYAVQSKTGSSIPLAQMPYIRAKDIIIVYVGGITYTEMMLLWQVNQGIIDNNQETLMKFGKSVSRKFAGTTSTEGVNHDNNKTSSNSNSPDVSTSSTLDYAKFSSSEPYTAKIEARVSLVTTAAINSMSFLNSLPKENEEVWESQRSNS